MLPGAGLSSLLPSDTYWKTESLIKNDVKLKYESLIYLYIQYFLQVNLQLTSADKVGHTAVLLPKDKARFENLRKTFWQVIFNAYLLYGSILLPYIYFMMMGEPHCRALFLGNCLHILPFGTSGLFTYRHKHLKSSIVECLSGKPCRITAVRVNDSISTTRTNNTHQGQHGKHRLHVKTDTLVFH